MARAVDAPTVASALVVSAGLVLLDPWPVTLLIAAGVTSAALALAAVRGRRSATAPARPVMLAVAMIDTAALLYGVGLADEPVWVYSTAAVVGMSLMLATIQLALDAAASRRTRRHRAAALPRTRQRGKCP